MQNNWLMFLSLHIVLVWLTYAYWGEFVQDVIWYLLTRDDRYSDDDEPNDYDSPQ